MPFEFKQQHDYDLHIALEVEAKALEQMLAKGRAAGIETRGVSDHGFIHSIYFRDPNGYVIELTAKLPGHDQAMDPATNGARAKLDRWQAREAGSSGALSKRSKPHRKGAKTQRVAQRNAARATERPRQLHDQCWAEGPFAAPLRLCAFAVLVAVRVDNSARSQRPDAPIARSPGKLYYRSHRADLIAACGRVINVAKARGRTKTRPRHAAGFFVFQR